jgi:2-succinyl-5-enolpyruvyl-6-hydroxy-3-cyclohexene-1-carboxylate synthase
VNMLCIYMCVVNMSMENMSDIKEQARHCYVPIICDVYSQCESLISSY